MITLTNRLISKSVFPVLVACMLFACQGQSSHYLDAEKAGGLKKFLHYAENNMHLLSAHRGGPDAGFPENCIATFENTLTYCYSMMEIDPRYTRDSIIVVHHDNTLERTTTGQGRVDHFSFEELKQFRLKDTEGNTTPHQIQTLDEMLEWAKGKTILVLDKKDVPVEVSARKVTEHRAEDCAIVMAYNFDEAITCYRLNPNIMMQVFINNREEIVQFGQTGIPWENVVVFTGHQKPGDMSVYQLLHEKGVLCIMGTSRNFDREHIEGKVGKIDELSNKYNSLYHDGVDILETDIPVPVSKIMTQHIFLSK